MSLLSVVIVRDVSHDFVPEDVANCFNRQKLSVDKYELIIPLTEKADIFEPLVKQYQDLGITVKSFRTTNTTRAKMTNEAIAKASGEVILFLAEDFIPTEELLSSHYELHLDNPQIDITVYGPAQFSDRAAQKSKFTRWLDESGEIFGINFTKSIPRNTFYFYFGNSSVKSILLDKVGPINEDLPFPCQEDADLGLRLRSRGVQGYYAENAKAIHDHELLEDERLNAMIQAGYSSGILNRNIISFINLLARQCIKLTILFVALLKGKQENIWRFRLHRNYLRGIFKYYLEKSLIKLALK